MVTRRDVTQTCKKEKSRLPRRHQRTGYGRTAYVFGRKVRLRHRYYTQGPKRRPPKADKPKFPLRLFRGGPVIAEGLSPLPVRTSHRSCVREAWHSSKRSTVIDLGRSEVEHHEVRTSANTPGNPKVWPAPSGDQTDRLRDRGLALTSRRESSEGRTTELKDSPNYEHNSRRRASIPKDDLAQRTSGVRHEHLRSL